MQVAKRSAARFAIANVLSKPIQTQQVVCAMKQFRAQAPNGARVLVIDDDPIALELMRSTLAGIEIEPTCVADGRQALIDIERHRPDAIILDLIMPEFDGFAVLDALRHMPAWANTPVFVWTSMELTDDEYAGLAKSARAILNKGGGELTEMLYNLRRWRQPDTLVQLRSET
jgi:CheY-like chemotaxis protein